MASSCTSVATRRRAELPGNDRILRKDINTDGRTAPISRAYNDFLSDLHGQIRIFKRVFVVSDPNLLCEQTEVTLRCRSQDRCIVAERHRTSLRVANAEPALFIDLGHIARILRDPYNSMLVLTVRAIRSVRWEVENDVLVRTVSLDAAKNLLGLSRGYA